MSSNSGSFEPSLFLRGILLVGGFRSRQELNAMSPEVREAQDTTGDVERRNTLIEELRKHSNQTVKHFQAFDDNILAGKGAILVYIRRTNIRNDADLQNMSDDDLRNTLIVEYVNNSSNNFDVQIFQALSDVQLVLAGLGQPVQGRIH
jgi:hypothetical protein